MKSDTLREILIQGAAFRLRSWHQDDPTSLAELANNKKIWMNLRDLFPHPYTLQDAEEWIQIATSDEAALHLAIEVAGEAVGAISLVFNQDVYCNSAEIGYWLGEPFWGRGIMTAAVQALTEHSFRNHDLCRIYAPVFGWNKASMRVLEKAGFSQEARHEKAVYKNKTYTDEVIFAIIR